MATPIDLFLQGITEALTRIRALLFVSLGLCAIVLSNAYLENFPFDDAMVKNAYVFREVFDQKKKELTAQWNAATDSDEKRRLFHDISELRARIDRIDNSLKDYKLRAVTIPLTGVNIPANDLNVVCGIFLLFLSLWLVFSVNQLQSALRDESMRSGLLEYLPALRHSMMLALPKEQRLLRGLAVLLITAPAIAMTIATFNDLNSVLFFDFKQPLFALFSTVLMRLVFLTAVAAGLWVSAVVCLRAWMGFRSIIIS
jgi:hypothetical protein